MPPKKQALRKLVLPARQGAQQRHTAPVGDDLLQGRLMGRVGRPGGWDEQVRNLAVRRVHRQWLAEIDEVPAQVHVLVRSAAQVRETIGVEGMEVERGHPRVARLGAPLRIVQREHLHPAATKPIHTMAATANDKKPVRIRRPVAHHIQSQGFAFVPRERMRVRLDG